MLAPDSRALLLDALRPPPGCALDRAVATTFTLDLATTLMIPLAFAGFRFAAQPDPIEMMQSLRQMSARFDIFCQAGAIRAGAWPSDLVALLEDVIHEARRPRPGHVFHPKVWVLRFVGESMGPSYRLLVLSRNLTADRSWDTILWLDGAVGRRMIAANRPLERFVAALPGLATTTLPSDRREAIERLAEELRQVEWERPAGVSEVHFHPSGLRGLPPLDLHNLLAGSRRLVVSPFVRTGALGRVFDHAPAGRRVLVSRGEELDALPLGALDGVEAYELDPMAGLAPEGIGDAPVPAPPSNLHAKLFLVERARRAHLFVGSVNATDAGFNGNVEFLCEMVGSPSGLGVEALVGADAAFRAMLKPYTPPDQPAIEDEEAGVARELEELLFDVAQIGFRIEATEHADGWAQWVTSDAPLPAAGSARVTLAPHNRTGEAVVLAPGAAVGLELKAREAADVTPFLQITASRAVAGQTLERSTVVCARLIGAPASRLDEIFVRQIGTSEKFLRLLALLLGLDAASPGTAFPVDGLAGSWAAGPDMGVLELLARALADRPVAIDQLASIVEHLRASPTGSSILPSGWDSVWLPAFEARRAIAETQS